MHVGGHGGSGNRVTLAQNVYASHLMWPDGVPFTNMRNWCVRTNRPRSFLFEGFPWDLLQTELSDGDSPVENLIQFCNNGPMRTRRLFGEIESEDAAVRHYLVRPVQLASWWMATQINGNIFRKKLSPTFDKYLHLIVYRVEPTPPPPNGRPIRSLNYWARDPLFGSSWRMRRGGVFLVN